MVAWHPQNIFFVPVFRGLELDFRTDLLFCSVILHQLYILLKDHACYDWLLQKNQLNIKNPHVAL